MGSITQGLIDPQKRMLGVERIDTGEFNQYKLTPEQRESEKRLLAQLEKQSLNAGPSPESDQAQRQAMSMAASQSRNSSNPFLGMKAAAMANMEGQEMAKTAQLNRQAQSQQLLANVYGGKSQQSVDALKAQTGQRSDENKQRSQVAGDVMSSLSNVFSDKKKKENIDAVQDSGGKIDEFLSKIDPYTFEYKDESLGGKQMGVMAQDLEKSDIGRSLVENHPEGKTVRVDKIGLPILAAQSDMFKRIKELEDKVKKRK